MYYVNKIVGWCMSPLGLLFVGLAVGFFMSKRFRFGKWLVGMVLAAFWVVSCGFSIRWIGLPLEGDEAFDPRANLPPRPLSAVVLLGGGMGVHEKCGRPEVFEGADRVWTAAKFFNSERQRCGDVVMTVSGGGAKAELMMLGDLGVDTNRVLVIEEARNTEEEARLIRGRLSSSANLTPQSKPVIALVTSAWHMPRAKRLFERAGFEVVPVPTDYEMHFACESQYKFRDFFPNAESLERNSCAIKEWVARACYRIIGK